MATRNIAFTQRVSKTNALLVGTFKYKDELFFFFEWRRRWAVLGILLYTQAKT